MRKEPRPSTRELSPTIGLSYHQPGAIKTKAITEPSAPRRNPRNGIKRTSDMARQRTLYDGNITPSQPSPQIRAISTNRSRQCTRRGLATRINPLNKAVLPKPASLLAFMGSTLGVRSLDIPSKQPIGPYNNVGLIRVRKEKRTRDERIAIYERGGGQLNESMAARRVSYIPPSNRSWRAIA